ncbi:MAG: SDR family NAD(P)-dependent oxidoreductase, partial [Gemmatimonadales bacterium]
DLRVARGAARGVIDFTGRRAFVTGGGRGIGRATVLLLAQGGARVAVGYRSRREEAEETLRAAQAGPASDRAVAVGGDLGDPEVARRVVEQVAANLDSVFFVCRAAIPHLADGGRIVLVASTADQRGEAFHTDYAATKGAVIALTKSLAVELAPRVNVNCVAPGWEDTAMARTPYGRDEGNGRREIERTIPLGRVASPEDIAGPIAFLCSGLARHITGEILNVNGGSVLCG